MGKSISISMYEACLIHSRADRAIRLALARQLDEFNLTMMQWLLLATAAQGSNSGQRMTELAATLEVTMPQITALMNDLVELKLVKQKINSTDRRSRRLVVATEGKLLLKRIETNLENALCEWLKDIPEESLKTYLDTSRKIADISIDSA